MFDIVDENGIPTGEIVERSVAHSKGYRHRTAHIWIARKINNSWQLLLQKRSQNKDSFPGRYDTSSAGHITAGHEPLESAKRELEEELGIKALDGDLEYADKFVIDYSKEFYGKTFIDKEIAFVYVYTKDVDISSLKLQEEEVECVEWFDVSYLNEVLRPPRDKKFCVPIEGFDIVKTWCEKKDNV